MKKPDLPEALVSLVDLLASLPHVLAAIPDDARAHGSEPGDRGWDLERYFRARSIRPASRNPVTLMQRGMQARALLLD
jgi:hypothetical protein